MVGYPSRDARLHFLQSLSPFAALGADRLASAMPYIREMTLARGEAAFRQGDMLAAVFVVRSGALALSLTSEDGKEVIIRQVAAGGMLGENDVILGLPAPYEGIALAPTTLMRIAAPVFEAWLDEPAFTKPLLHAMSAQVREVLDFAETVSLYTLETRLARLFLKLCDQTGRAVEDGILIDRPLSQSTIGRMINASRPKINLQMRRWHCLEVIRVRGSRITVLDPDALTVLSRPMR
ncbi:Crp/Fnr family transcriptional regulator [Stappia sp.]|uniref:Crp/Fnr family transcriptional regulator n=1 Tax=Stappia sp. TaxID=1870903 RepID=UPI0032D92AAA